jgi:hypothetical protein
MKNRIAAATASVLLAVAMVATGTTPAHATYQLGARSCAYGYDAFTAAGPGTRFSATIIHQQWRGSERELRSAYTYAGQVRKITVGWQSFSGSSVSDQAEVRFTGCM